MKLWINDPIPVSGLNGAPFHPAWLVEPETEADNINTQLGYREFTVVMSFCPKFMVNKFIKVQVKIPYLMVEPDFSNMSSF